VPIKSLALDQKSGHPRTSHRRSGQLDRKPSTGVRPCAPRKSLSLSLTLPLSLEDAFSFSRLLARVLVRGRDERGQRKNEKGRKRECRKPKRKRKRESAARQADRRGGPLTIARAPNHRVWLRANEGSRFFEQHLELSRATQQRLRKGERERERVRKRVSGTQPLSPYKSWRSG